MFCEKCGTDIGDNRKCPICGHENIILTESGSNIDPPKRRPNQKFAIIATTIFVVFMFVGAGVLLHTISVFDNGDRSGTGETTEQSAGGGGAPLVQFAGGESSVQSTGKESAGRVSDGKGGVESDEPQSADNDYIVNQEAAGKLKTIDANIPKNADTFEGHSYYIYDDGCESWNEAKKCCESRGGYLAVINSAKENEHLFDYMISENKDEVFFGYTDQGQEGTWTWVNNKDSNFTDWGINSDGVIEPNADSVYEDYAHMNSAMHDGHWNDKRFGKTTSYYFCEWNLINYQGKDCKGTAIQDKVPMRNNAKNEADVIVNLKQNEEVRVLYQLTRENGKKWYYVQHKSGEVGYVDAKLLEVK